MRKRGDRALKTLYDITDRILQPEITPVLEGSCRIQGPVDESNNDLVRTNSGKIAVEKRYIPVHKNNRSKTESGTCNVCSAPCSSCMHLGRTASVVESEVDCSFTDNNFGRKGVESCSFIGKSGTCDHQHAVSETSNFFGASSSHDSYSENTESKAALRASVFNDPSDAVDMPPKVPSNAAIGDARLFPRKTNVAHDPDTSNNKTFLTREEEQHASDCHGDSISCITGVRDTNDADPGQNTVFHKKNEACYSASTDNLLAKGLEDAVEVHDHDIVERQSNLREPSQRHRDPLQKRNAGASFDNDVFLNKSEIPSERIPSPKVKYLCSSSQEEHFIGDVDSRDLARNQNSHSQVKSSECSIENVESSLGGHLAAGATEQKLTVPVNESKIASHKRGDNPSMELKDTDLCIQSGTGVDNGISSDVFLKGRTTNEQHGNAISLVEASKIQGTDLQSESILEGDNSESDSVLHDVKVCDICGDAGREDKLAICSRCIDGAEHTYCMRIMCLELPEGDWLCELCKADITESKKDENADNRYNLLKVTSVNENNNKPVKPFNPKLLPMLDIKSVGPEATESIKEVRTPKKVPIRDADNHLDSPNTSKMVSEVGGGYIGTASPKKRSILSREGSFKDLDTKKGNSVKLGWTCEGQSGNKSPGISCLQTSSSSRSLKVQVQSKSPRVLVSKSNSFNSSMKQSPKVKQLNEKFLHKLKSAKESTSGEARNKEIARTMTKSLSYKGMSTVHSNIEPVVKTKSFNLSRGKELSFPKQVNERNNSFVQDRTLVRRLNPSSPAGGNFLLPKADQKVSHDAKLENVFETKNLSSNKGSVAGKGSKELKKQSSYLHKNSVSQSSDGTSEDKKSNQDPKESVRVRTQGAESAIHNDKSKGSAIFSISKQAISVGSRPLRCQRCNETGHATQCCPIDKLSVSALNPSAERQLRDGIIKRSNKGKDAVDATNSKTRIQKKTKLSEQLEEFSVPIEELSCGIVSKDILSSSSSKANDILPLKGTIGGHEILRTSDAKPSKPTVVTEVRQQSMHSVESSHVPTLDVLNELPDEASIHENSLRASAIPEFDFIWIGDFEVLRNGRSFELFDGIQAHLSSYASPKVLEVVTELPDKLQLEEVPRTSSWPVQFQENGPEEDNIALFLFAKDEESYEKSYQKLLQNMLTNDLALRAAVGVVEFLIFPSDKLPANSQRWNGLYFLWGVFRGRSTSCIETQLGLRKEHLGSTLSTNPLNQDLCTDAINYQKTDSNENQDIELSRCDRSAEAEAMTCGVFNKPSEHFECSNPVGCSLETGSQKPVFSVPCPKASLPCQEWDINDAYPINDTECGEAIGSAVHVHTNNVQTTATDLPVSTDSPNLRQGPENSRTDDKMRDKRKLIKMEAVLEDDPMEEDRVQRDHLCSVLRPNNKRANLCSVEIAPQNHGEAKPTVTEVEDDRESKKMKYNSELHGGRSPSTLYPLLASFSSKASGEVNEESRAAERCFFPFELGHPRDTRPNNLIDILSSDDEEPPESRGPDLELALVGKEQSPERRAVPWLFPLTDRIQGNPARPEADEDDSASLTLSLAFPPSAVKPVTKTELPERPDINTSLFLFGGFPNTW